MPLKIEGQRFGRLVAIKHLRSEKKKVIWLFQCDCGNIAELPATYVVRLHTQSCGCYRVDRLRDAVSVDITGRRFGRLVAIEQAGSDGGRVQWLCKCDCGNEVVRASKNLRNGTAVSCGCRKAEAGAENIAARVVDLTGLRFGKLVAVSSFMAGHGLKMWKCKCDCGGEKVARHGDIQSGKVISCGCAARENISYMPIEARHKGVAHCSKRRARIKGAKGFFTKEQIDELFVKQRGMCACCRNRLSDDFHRDHIIPLSLGGDNTIENIQLLCPACNMSKGAKDPIQWANENGRLL